MKKVTMGAVAALVVAGAFGAPAQAAPVSPADSKPEGLVLADFDVAEFESALAGEGIDLGSAEISTDELAIEGTSQLGSGEDVTTEAKLDPQTSTAVIEYQSEDPELDGTTHRIDINELNEDKTDFTVTDTATGESERYTGTEGAFSAIPLVLGIPIAVSFLEALFFATAVVTVAGVTYVAATEAIEAIRDRGSEYQHFRALRQPGGLFIGDGMTYGAAIGWGRMSKDTWSRSQRGAQAIAFGIKNFRPVGPEIDKGGSGKYWHYHPANRTPNMHAFYGGPR
jgi:hypothetical protein